MESILSQPSVLGKAVVVERPGENVVRFWFYEKHVAVVMRRNTSRVLVEAEGFSWSPTIESKLTGEIVNSVWVRSGEHLPTYARIDWLRYHYAPVRRDLGHLLVEFADQLYAAHGVYENSPWSFPEVCLAKTLAMLRAEQYPVLHWYDAAALLQTPRTAHVQYFDGIGSNHVAWVMVGTKFDEMTPTAYVRLTFGMHHLIVNAADGPVESRFVSDVRDGVEWHAAGAVLADWYEDQGKYTADQPWLRMLRSGLYPLPWKFGVT